MSHLIIKNINDYQENFYNNTLSIIKKAKQQKINNLKNDHHRKESILGEYLLIKTLKRFYHLNYQNINISYNQNNKPYLSHHQIYYSISHSHGLTAIYISSKKCGIDIQRIQKVDSSIIKSFATLKEQEYISEKNSLIRLYEIYTLKEAYIKMIGSNLFNIKSIEFIIKNNQIICNNHHLKITIKHYKNYLISICEEL